MDQSWSVFSPYIVENTRPGSNIQYMYNQNVFKRGAEDFTTD